MNVVYPKSFDTVALSEEIDSLFKIMEKNFSMRLNKELQKTISAKSITLPNDKVVEIENEIEVGDGKVEASTNIQFQQEENGQGNINSNLSDSFKTNKEVTEEDTAHRKKE